MFTLGSKITITDPTGDFTITNFPICKVEIKRSRKELTATAKITMPRNFSYKLSGKAKLANPSVNINSLLKRGSAISISLGYVEYGLNVEFQGYITQVSSGFPLEIECQDEMWKLKQTSFTKTWKSKTKIYDIVSDIYNSGSVNIAPAMQIGGLVAIKQSAAQILEGLSKYGFHSYFDTNWTGQSQLIVDFAEALHPGSAVNYDFSKNVIENKNLTYKTKEDVLIKVDAVSMQPNGTKLKPKTLIGDANGETHTLTYYNLSLADLTNVATKELAKLKYDGYRGYFTTFGVPLAKPGDKAVLVDPLYTDRNGTYLIEAVETEFGIDGFRRKIILERKLSS